MLAARRQTMDPFDASANFPFPSPTAPAPGPSLLDDSESKYLDSFFDGVSSDHFNFDFFANSADGSDPALGWDGLPPNFMGTSSSFGPQPTMGSQVLGGMDYLNSHYGLSASAPAATHLGNGSAPGMTTNAPFPDSSMGPPSGQGTSLGMPQYAPPRNPAAREGPGSRNDFLRGTPFYTDMVFGNRAEDPTRPRQSISHAKGDICWGSDSNFVPTQPFVPANHERKLAESLEISHIKAVEEALCIDDHKKSGSPSSSPRGSPGPGHSSLSHPRTKTIGYDDGPDSRQVKRRKSNFQAELDGSGGSSLSAAHRQGMRKQKPIKRDESLSPSGKSGQKRGKAAAAAVAAKTTRENLTEEQKRENHIKSEQKRRTLIREGFEDLNQLVPGLRGGGFSKSAVLIMSADWLENLLQGNEELRQRLGAMQNGR